MKRLYWLIIGLVVFGANSGIAAEGKLKGYMFGDYYFNTSGPNKNRNAFEFRRIYFTYDIKWDEQFSGRLRFESNDPGFGSNGTLNPKVKDAYLRYKKNGRALEAGLSPTPTWNVTEEIWGYRAIEKTIMDLNKISSSRDHGIAFRGPLDGGGRVNLQLMLGNGNSNKSEVDNEKKIYGLVDLRPKGDLVVLAYGDWQKDDRRTLAAVIGKQGKGWHGGIELFTQTLKRAGADPTSQGLSLFAAKRVRPKVKAFGRVDAYDPNTDADDDRTILVIGGVDIEPTKDVHIMPNLWLQSNDRPGVDTTVMPRITGFFKF